MAKPLGERVLPEEYIRSLTKPTNLSWEQFREMARRKFQDGQQKELEKQREYEERTRNAMIEAEKIFKQNLKIKQEKEHQRRLAEAKKLEEEAARKQQEEEERIQNEERERLRREEAERLRREEEEHLRKEEEERLHKEEEERQAKEELERLQREEEERLRKEEEEKLAKEEAENILKDSLCSLVSSGTKSDPIDLSSEDMIRELADLCSKRLGIDHADIHLRQSIAELGSLIMDEDVLFTLRNLKQLGIEMRKSRRTLFEQEKEESDDIVFNGSGSAANSPVVGILHIKQEKDEHNGVKTRSSSNLRSPPPQLFHGMKRYSKETFSETMSQSKKRKTGNTPSRQRHQFQHQTEYQHRLTNVLLKRKLSVKRQTKETISCVRRRLPKPTTH